ncbi:MAG: GSCFA domain-containing protein [Saprospiraceae bacterium]|nr:GSCFA domain-containing protein [Saprospiraceae bacterium]
MTYPSFRTILPVLPAPFRMEHTQRWMLVGSCFTEHIGARLAACKFHTQVNPNGIVYNPVSMASCLTRLLEGTRPYQADELFHHDGLWHSWEHHGRFSHPDKSAALAAINTGYRQGAAFLQECDGIVLTLGTAEVSVLRETGQIVANNHKTPAAWFETRRLNVGEIVESLMTVLQMWQTIRPHLRVIVSVSPVRHLRSGLVENQRSKAALLLAGAVLSERLEGVVYFPAYEWLMDDLRDYRFYAADMLHPSEAAIDYIWANFAETFFSEKTRALNVRIEKIRAAALHRPFHSDSEPHQAFLRAQLEAIAALRKEVPQLDFTAEENQFVEQMTLR